MRIVLDAMGSDDHPEPEIQAAIRAVKLFGDQIILVGDKNSLSSKIDPELIDSKKINIVHAPEVFYMTDKISISALRKAKNSMGVGMDLLKSGEADALVSAGNTGGLMAIGLARLHRIKGIKRPALSAMFPVKGGYCVIADIGANAECKPEYLVQFAIMGSLYAKKALGISNPRVGIISNGEEPGKGNDLVKATFPLLEKSNLNFIGNIEGKELFAGEADVAVTDGFTGNVLLKSSEAVAKLISETLKEEMYKSTRTKIGGILAKPAFVKLQKMLDPSEVGAVPLLGLDGLVFVAHGRSNTKALVSAIKSARAAVKVNLLESIRNSIANQI